MFWIAAELPPEIPAICVAKVAAAYDIPPALLVAIYKQERGVVGKEYPRSHGTYYGPWQISDKWLPVINKWGYDSAQLRDDGCVNAIAGAYVLAYYFVREQNWPRAVARYNTGSINTPEQIDAGRRYVEKVYAHWEQIYEKWTLDAKQ